MILIHCFLMKFICYKQCSVLLRDTICADCTGYGDLVLLAYFIENTHTVIQSIHTCTAMT